MWRRRCARHVALFVVLIGVWSVHVMAESLLHLDDCGRTKTCYRQPAGCINETECRAFVSWKPVDKLHVQIETWGPLKTAIPTTGVYGDWLAVGFSNDELMGDDSVTYCYSYEGIDPGEGEPGQGINIGHTAGKSFVQAVNDPDTEKNVQLDEVRRVDDQMICRFTQRINHGHNRNDKPNFADLSKPWRLLLAHGAMEGINKLSIHNFGTELPYSTEPVDLLSKPEPENSSEDSPAIGTRAEASSGSLLDLQPKTKKLFKNLHGGLMLIAWLGLVFTAVYAARHLRDHWEKTIGGLQIWFLIHRTLNFIAVCLIILAAIFIFLATGISWTGPSINASSETNFTAGAIHSLTGILATILVIMQPIGAMFRPDKDSSRRPFFNIAHRTAGLAACVLAVITIGIAAIWFMGMWADATAAKWIFIVFVVVAIIVIAVQGVLRIRDAREQARVTAMEMHNKPGNAAPSDSYYYRNRQVHSAQYKRTTMLMFLLFSSLSLCVAVVLALIVFAS